MQYFLRNLRAISVTDGSVLLTWSPGDDDDNVVLRNNPDVQYEIYYKAITENSSNAAVFESDKVRNCLACCLKLGLQPSDLKLKGHCFGLIWLFAVHQLTQQSPFIAMCEQWTKTDFLFFCSKMPFLQVAKEIVDLQSKLSSQLDVIITFHPVQ